MTPTDQGKTCTRCEGEGVRYNNAANCVTTCGRCKGTGRKSPAELLQARIDQLEHAMQSLCDVLPKSEPALHSYAARQELLACRKLLESRTHAI